MKDKVIRTNAVKAPEVDLGTVTLSQTYSSSYDGTTFPKGTVLKIGRMMTSPTGRRSYKIFGTTHWVSDHEVYNVTVTNIPKRRTVKIYSA
jgi:hypothetical protein